MKRDTTRKMSAKQDIDQTNFSTLKMVRRVTCLLMPLKRKEISPTSLRLPLSLWRVSRKEVLPIFSLFNMSFNDLYNRGYMMVRDLTGSGKTLGFSLPLVEYLRKNKLFGTRRP
jgi:hypothetical protein